MVDLFLLLWRLKGVSLQRMKMRFDFFVLMLVFNIIVAQVNLFAREFSVGQYDNGEETRILNLSNREFVSVMGVPLVLTAASIATIPLKESFYDTRNYYVADFHHSYDDYTQYAPAALMLGLKACGVRSRSSWGRMLTADVFSVAIMSALVNGAKYSFRVKRPDGSARNSYPSGHTATAFMTATMLHKEYGGVSKWFSIGAYSCATLTGVTRVLNNRHWVSDVMLGAAIGVVSTEVAYYLADLIFKDRGLNSEISEYKYRFGADYRPSYAAVFSSVNMLGLKGYEEESANSDCALMQSSRVGVEGGYFLNRSFGVGAQLSVMSAGVQQAAQRIGMVSTMVGPLYSYLLSDRWRIGARCMGGFDAVRDDCGVCEREFAASALVGANLSFLMSENFGVKLLLDYRPHLNLFGSRTAHELSGAIAFEALFGRVQRFER